MQPLGFGLATSPLIVSKPLVSLSPNITTTGFVSPVVVSNVVSMGGVGQRGSNIKVGMSLTDGKGNKFRVDKELGAGCFGSVFKMQRSDGKIVAVKVQPRTAQMEEIRKEIRLLKSMRHDNIVSFFDDFTYTIPGTASTFILIVMEFCGGGTLQSAIKKRKATGGYRSHEIFAICAQLAEGLAYIHKSNVTHRDLKSENIMLTADGIIKISDFGRGRFMHGQTAFTTTSGDRMVIPPEFMNKALSGQMGVVGPKYDCWGLGCILSELITSQLLSIDRCRVTPLGGDMNALRQLFTEVRGMKGGQFSKLLEGLLAPDPNTRFSSRAVHEALTAYLAALEKQQNEQKNEKEKQQLTSAIAAAKEAGVDATECERLFGLFQQVDKAGTGKISASDLHHLLILLGVKASARWVIQSIDTNHDNAVDFAELVKWWGQRNKTWVPPVNKESSQEKVSSVFRLSREIYDKIKAAFAQLDTDDSGTIPTVLMYNLLVLVGVKVTPSQLPIVMQSLGPAPEENEMSLDDVLQWWRKNMSENSLTFGKWQVGDSVECRKSSGGWALAKVTKVSDDLTVFVEFVNGSGSKELALKFHNCLRKPKSPRS